MPDAAVRSILKNNASEEVSVRWMDGWDWVWMTFMMDFWLIVLGAVVYVAVRLGQQPSRKDG
jgi:hypothetical protein